MNAVAKPAANNDFKVAGPVARPIGVARKSTSPMHEMPALMSIRQAVRYQEALV